MIYTYVKTRPATGFQSCVYNLLTGFVLKFFKLEFLSYLFFGFSLLFFVLSVYEVILNRKQRKIALKKHHEFMAKCEAQHKEFMDNFPKLS